MKLIEKIKKFFTPKTVFEIMEEEDLAYKNLDPAKVNNPFLKCALCDYVRSNQDMKDAIRDYRKHFITINGITKCYICLQKEQDEKPHCKSCSCEGKIHKSK